MRTTALLLVTALTAVTTTALLSTKIDAAENSVSMQRLYNPNSGEHFYTANTNEKNSLVNVGWHYEGIGWIAPTTGEPVYRLYNPNSGDHHYTLNASERDNLVRNGWKNEGTGWNSDSNKAVPLYRAYNPNAWTGSHNYTTDKAEQGNLISAGWKDEGIGWYGIATDSNGGGTGGGNGGGGDTYYREGLLDASNATETVRLLNEYRTSLGLQPLTQNDDIRNATDIRAYELTQKFDHTRPNGANWKTAYVGPVKTTPFSEVICKIPVNSSTKSKPEQALALFKASFSHNAILTDEYAQVIGASYYQTSNGDVYVAWNLGIVIGS